MNYIGSKLSLLNFLEESIQAVVDANCSTFADLFAGTGIVGSHFKKRGYRVIANDFQYYSFVLNRHYIGNHRELQFAQLLGEIPELEHVDIGVRKNFVCDYLSKLKGVPGFIYKHYCLGGTEGTGHPRQYFSDANGKRADAIRQRIEDWKLRRAISEDEYYFLLASLIESIDKYANTASVYGAFLKTLKKSAQKSLEVLPAELIVNDKEHAVFNEDINDVLGKVQSDIVYLDPPYNHRQYATNYHLLETIAQYDSPEIYGKTGLRDYRKQKSLYCSKRQVKQIFTELIQKIQARYIFLSYNNEGLMSMGEIREIMEQRGAYGFFAKEYNRFKADKTENRNFAASDTTEYLHYVACEDS